MLFQGGFRSTIDQKGNIDLSVFCFFKKAASQNFFLATIEPDRCLSLYPATGDRFKIPKGEGISSWQPVIVRKRILTVPRELAEYAKLTKHIQLIGCGNRIDILDRKIWLRMEEQTKKDLEKLEETWPEFGKFMEEG